MDPYNDPIGVAAQGGQGTSSRHASDWGLGSLLIGLTLLLLFPLVLGVLLVGGPFVVHNMGSGSMPQVMLMTDVTAYGFVALSLLALLFGMVGLVSGFVRNQPVGLATAGLLVGILVLVLWVLMFFGIMEAKRNAQQQRNNQPGNFQIR